VNWVAIGAVGETLGAVAVFVTLGYLAIQVRQANRSTVAATTLEIIKMTNDMNREISSDTALRALYVVGCNRPDDLSAEDTVAAGL
jgi:hypothetical protein